MSFSIIHEFLPWESNPAKKLSYNKSEKESAENYEGKGIKVGSKFILNRKYKTELCKNFMKTSQCWFGDQCCYAH